MKLSPPTRVSDPAISGAAQSHAAPRRPSPLLRSLWRKRFYLLLVVLPTLIAGIYFYGFAAGQYVSEARYLVRGRQDSRGASSLTEMMGAAGFKQVSEESLSVRDYLQSHDALHALKEGIDIVGLYRRPEADLLGRLWFADPPDEILKMYHGMMNTVVNDSTSGITTLRARAFRPEDAQRIAEEQLRLAELFVNHLSARSREESLRSARDELERAEQRVLASQAAITEWRLREQSVDPTGNAQIGMEGLGALEGALTGARAELQEKSSFMRPDNPQIVTIRNRIASLQREIAEQRRRMTHDGALPGQLATYERLALEREFANKQLASATLSLETARLDAQRQQIFLARVVEPNLADYPLYPRAAVTLLSIFIVLSVLYGIGWMMLAGIREHAF